MTHYSKNSKKVIAFDLWNTLAYRKHITKFLEKESGLNHHKILRIYENLTCKHSNKTYNHILDLLIKKLELNYTEKQKIKFKATIIRKSKSGKLYKDVKPTLKKLKKHYKLVLISNATHFADELLKRTKLNTYFDHIFLSYQVGQLKPDKKMYHHVLNKLKIKPDQMIMVGDTYEDDVLASKRVGISAILLDRKNKHKDKERIKKLGELL